MAMTEQQVQLVVAAQSGNIKSFETLFAIYHEKVYALARMILKNSNNAEDVLQETFITAWRKLSTLETPPTFSVWIQIIAKNLCNMQLRKKNMAILLDAEHDIENFDVEDSVELLPAVYAERADLKERLGGIIDGLSEVQRQAIVLYYFNELSVDEIADVMECSANTIKTRLFLARKAIRSEIEEQERKSGQKFYSIAGVPTLPLGKLIQSHIASQSIGQSAAAASLNAVTNSIANSMDAAATAIETQNTQMEGMKMAKLSSKAKIIAGISAVAAVGAVAVLAAILTKATPPPAPTMTAAPAPTSIQETPVPPIESPEELEPTPTPTPTPQPIEGNVVCNWELTIKDSHEYIYTEDDESLKKIATIDISATKKGGVDYFGEYIGTGIITVFNALSPEDDALPVYFGGQYALTRKFNVRFTIEKIEDFEQPEGFTEFVERNYDGKAELEYSLKLDKIVGIFADMLELEGIAADLGVEFSFPDPEQSKAFMFVDGGYVFFSFEDDWQIPEPFNGYIVGVNTGRTTPQKTSPPSTAAPNPTPALPTQTATPAPIPTPDPTATPAPVTTPDPTATSAPPTVTPLSDPTPTPGRTRYPVELITPRPTLVLATPTPIPPPVIR